MNTISILLIILLCFCKTSLSESQNEFKRINNSKFFGLKKIYVIEPLGLNLRKGANLESEKILNIPYGSEVELVENEKSGITPHTSENIKGFFVYISFKGKLGFVFDGYLTRIKPIPLSCPSFKDYAIRNFGKPIRIRKEQVEQKYMQSEKIYEHYYYFNNHIVVHEPYSGQENQFQMLVDMNNSLSFEELFLFGKICSHKEIMKMKFPENFTNSIRLQMEEDSKFYYIEIKKRTLDPIGISLSVGRTE